MELRNETCRVDSAVGFRNCDMCLSRDFVASFVLETS